MELCSIDVAMRTVIKMLDQASRVDSRSAAQSLTERAYRLAQARGIVIHDNPTCFHVSLKQEAA